MQHILIQKRQEKYYYQKEQILIQKIFLIKICDYYRKLRKFKIDKGNQIIRIDHSFILPQDITQKVYLIYSSQKDQIFMQKIILIEI